MLDDLIIESTEDTPKITLSQKNNNFFIENKSLPEDAITFYKPVIDWIEQYLKNPNKHSKFNFKLEYFNTASAKQLAKILKSLEKIKDNIEVVWHYHGEDYDMLSSGKRFEKLIDINFAFVKYN